MIRQNRWRAARYGLGAVLVDWRSGRPSPASDVIKGLVDRMSGTAEALGCAREMDLVRRMADGPGGADRQLAVFERTGDLVTVARLQAGDPTTEPGHPVAASLGRDALEGEVAGFGSEIGTVT